MSRPLPNAPEHSAQIDSVTLEHMLSVGGDALRPALIDQLIADLTRIAEELVAARALPPLRSVAATSRSAHELKGLASTFGATGLASAANRLDQLADIAPAGVRDALGLGLHQELEQFRAFLRQRKRQPDAA